MSSLRMLLHACVDQDLKFHQLDVKTAYLHASLDSEIYVEQPQGYSILSDGNNLVWRLHNSLYGLKQSGRNWNFVLRDHLIESGFVQSKADYCLFVSRKSGGVIHIIFWIDDIIVAARSDT